MILTITPKLEDMLKAKAAAPGETRTHRDGRTWKKVGKKWVLVSNVQKVVAKTVENSETYFDHAMTTNLGGEVIRILESHGVSDFPSLVEKIKRGAPDTAHKIYKDIFDQIDKGPGTTTNKQAALHLIGTVLVNLRDQYTEGPKVKSTIKVTSHTSGKEYYKQDHVSVELPTIKPTEILAAKNKMGGWPITTELETSHVKAMLKNGSAKLIAGKIDPKRKWVMPKKAEDMVLKYAGDSLLIHVKQVRNVDKRTRATAKVDINIPYAFAKAFLLKHIESKKTRNNFIFRMELSKGYRAFLERAGSK